VFQNAQRLIYLPLGTRQIETDKMIKIENYFNADYLTELYNEKLSNSKVKGIDKLNSISFSKRLGNEIEIIKRKVISGNYIFSPYVEVLKLKGRKKSPRIISIPTLRDRIVLLTIKEILHHEFPNNVNRKLPNNYIREIKQYLSITSGHEYLIKLDIKKFYDNIKRSILIDKLRANELDPLIVNLIELAISTPTVPANTKRKNYDIFLPKKGVPQGLSISNILAQIYLNEVDKVIDKR